MFHLGVAKVKLPKEGPDALQGLLWERSSSGIWGRSSGSCAPVGRIEQGTAIGFRPCHVCNSPLLPERLFPLKSLCWEPSCLNGR